MVPRSLYRRFYRWDITDATTRRRNCLMDSGFSNVKLFIVIFLLIGGITKVYFLHVQPLLLYNDGKIQHFKATPVVAYNQKQIPQSNITCLLITSPSHYELAKHATHTWMTDCDHIQTMTSKMQPSLKNIVLTNFSSYEDLWGKVLDGFLSLDTTADWFLKVDDDTYVVMDNLRNFLQPLSADAPLVIGLQLIYPNNQVDLKLSSPYVSGGCGYILSREALKRLKGQMGSKNCSYIPWSPYEDVNMGACLDELGVRQVDTRDSLGRQRFLPFAPWILMNPLEESHPSHLWVKNEHKYPVLFGAEYITDEPISFHEIRKVNDIYQLHYFTKYFKKNNLKI